MPRGVFRLFSRNDSHLIVSHYVARRDQRTGGLTPTKIHQSNSQEGDYDGKQTCSYHARSDTPGR